MKLRGLNFWLLIVLTVVVILRIPSLFEPYWYGDEQIYLAIGQAMDRGAVLYRDIWDNKPPLLYFLYAIVPTLLWAKALATIFVLGTCVGIFALSKSLMRNAKNELFPLLATLLTGIFLSVPFLEGTIANAELFFTLPIVLGGALILKIKGDSGDHLKLHAIGLLVFLAFLFKVPAALDFAGMFLFLFIFLFQTKFRDDKSENFLWILIRTYLPIFLTFIVPLVLVVAYFFLNHALKDFVIAAFSQNASYVSVDSGPLSKLSNPLFVKAFILLLSSLILIGLYLKKLLSKELLFLSLWFGFSLYGALLSGRPYMHYLLQIVPPAAGLFVYAVYELFIGKKTRFGSIIVLCALAFVYFNLSQMFHSAFRLQFKPYYRNFIQYSLGQKSWNKYVSFFDSGTLNSYTIAKYLDDNSNSNDSIFVWGDAASVYVLSDRRPATRFIQAHHLTTIDPKNYDLIIQKLKIEKPKFILIKVPEHFQFNLLDKLVNSDYHESVVIGSFHIFIMNQNV